MAQVKVFYEPERELLTVFWQEPRRNQAEPRGQADDQRHLEE